MATLIPYLIFSGNCREALEFYILVFNGEIVSIQTFGDAPMDFPETSKNRIFDSEFKAGNIHFKASDDFPPNQTVTKGSNFSLFVYFSDIQFKKNTFQKLSEEGTILFPLDENFGMLKDKFGLQWMFTNEK